MSKEETLNFLKIQTEKLKNETSQNNNNSSFMNMSHDKSFVSNMFSDGGTQNTPPRKRKERKHINKKGGLDFDLEDAEDEFEKP